MTDLDLTPADDEALAYVERLLAADDLPTRDLGAGRTRFYVATVEGDRVGVGGIEPYDEVGLLRSVVVEEGARGRGIGSALCGALEDVARSAGVGTLYLLTTTATGFFADRGYVAVDRAAVPDAVRGTAEFSELCPDSATPMEKRL